MSSIEPSWHREVLPQHWSRAAGQRTSRSILGGFYLAGGTGLALHFGHRRSEDLDLFRESEFASAEIRNRLRGLEALGKLEASPETVYLQLNGVKVSSTPSLNRRPSPSKVGSFDRIVSAVRCDRSSTRSTNAPVCSEKAPLTSAKRPLWPLVMCGSDQTTVSPWPFSIAAR